MSEMAIGYAMVGFVIVLGAWGVYDFHVFCKTEHWCAECIKWHYGKCPPCVICREPIGEPHRENCPIGSPL